MIFTMRPSYVQGKQPQQQKAWFLEIWPCIGEKEKSRKWTEWMEGWWMSFSFCLSIYPVGPVVAVPKLWFLHSCLCFGDLGSFLPNDNHSLEEQSWHFAFTTSRVAPLRRQANLLLHGGWHRTRAICHWPWNVESTIRKAELPIHNIELDRLGKTGGHLQLRSFTFMHCPMFICNHFRPC